MDLPLFFGILGGLLVLAFVANRLVRFTRIPDVIILMATGVLVGPVFHWVKPDIFRGVTQTLGSLALILILFEGGLDLKLREILRHFGSGFFLSLFSFLVAMGAVGIPCRVALHLSWRDALLTGAVLGCTSSSIVFPVLQQIQLRSEVKVTLLVESSFGDAFAVLAVATLLNVASGGSAATRAVAWSLGSSLTIAVACGILAGMLWSYLLPMLSDQRFWHVLTFAALLLVYSGVHFIKGNELVSVLVFGLTLGNLPAVRRRLHIDETGAPDWFSEIPVKGTGGRSVDDFHQEQMLTFHGELAFLLRTFFFVLLGMLVDYPGIRKHPWLALSSFAAIMAARVIVVQIGRLAWRTFSPLERELMVWFVPRGLITAVLGIDVLQARGAAFEFLPSLAFAIILLTNLTLLIGSVRARNLPASEPELAEATPA